MQGQISKRIFAQNGGYRVYPLNLFRSTESMKIGEYLITCRIQTNRPRAEIFGLQVIRLRSSRLSPRGSTATLPML